MRERTVVVDGSGHMRMIWEEETLGCIDKGKRGILISSTFLLAVFTKIGMGEGKERRKYGFEGI